MADQPAGFQFAKPYDPTNPVSSDMRYGKYNGTSTIPFANIAEANELVKPALRYQGLQCAIINENTISLYWYRNGITNGDLVLLQTDVDLGPINTAIDDLNKSLFVELNGSSNVSWSSPLWADKRVIGFNLSQYHPDLPYVSSPGNPNTFGAYWIGTVIVDRTAGTGRMEATQWDVSTGKIVNKVERVKDDDTTYTNWGEWTFIPVSSTIGDSFNNKEDKLISYYTTQTASFNMAADMVDKTVRCNHASTPILATISDDNFFAIGAKFVIRKSNIASVTLAAAGGITLNAPQGLTLTRQYSQMQVIKQATNNYSVIIMGDDPTKWNKTEIVKAINYGWAVPRVTQPSEYFEYATTVVKITTINVATIRYAIGTSAAVLVPLTITGANGTATTAIAIPAGSWVKWTITYQTGAADAAAYINYL